MLHRGGGHFQQEICPTEHIYVYKCVCEKPVAPYAVRVEKGLLAWIIV